MGRGSGTEIATGSNAVHDASDSKIPQDMPGIGRQTATDSNADINDQYDITVITAFAELDKSVRHQEIPKGAKEAAIRLPKTLAASGFIVAEATPSDAMLQPDYIPDEGEVTVEDSLIIEDVTWELTGKNGSPTVYEEGREKNCAYYYRAVLPEGYVTVRDMDLPEIEVWYGFSYRNGSDFAGSGTEGDPWRITDYADLERLAAKVDGEETYESKFFKLDDSFDTGGGALTTSIGGLWNVFNGTFDGSGKTIELAISSEEDGMGLGLFSYVGSNGTVKNVIVSGFVTGGWDCIGGVVGNNEGTIENCGNTSVVRGDNGSDSIGGVTGKKFNGSIKGCWNSGPVQGWSNVGGVVGYNIGAMIERCWNSGTVQGGSSVGGVAGGNQGHVNGCYNVGRVSAVHGGAGGIADFDGDSVSDCVSLGVTVNGGQSNDVGRIVAQGSPNLSGNKARADMLIGPADSLEVVGDDATRTQEGINGENVVVDGGISLADIFSGWETNGWEVPPGNLETGCELPIQKDAVEPPEPPTLPGEVMYEKPEMDGSLIFANGTPIILMAGKTDGQRDDAKTVIWLDLDNDGVVTAGVDKIWDPDGAGSLVDTEAGNDLSGKWIFGGRNIAPLTGDTKITMLGGSVSSICGGGMAVSGGGAPVSGSTSVMMSGGTAEKISGGGWSTNGDVQVERNSTVTLSGTAKVDVIYGGGYRDFEEIDADIKGRALVNITGSASAGKVYLGGTAHSAVSRPSVGPGSALTIGGDVSIGSGQQGEGIFLNGGTGTDKITNGVDSFVISHDLTNAVQVVVPKGYSASEDSVIATDAVQGDLDHISLTGVGAAGFFTKYLASDNKIALTKNITYAVTVDVRKDGAAWTDHGKTFRLTKDAGQSFVTDLTAVKNGTYDVYEGDVDTGADVTVDGSAATSSHVDYYTVTFCNGTAAYGNGTDWKPQIVLKNGTASRPSSTPVKQAHTFNQWVTADGGNETFDFENTSITTATRIYASWTKNQAQKFMVTVDGSYALESGAGNYEQGENVTISAGIRSGHRFNGWTVLRGGVRLDDRTSADTSFEMPAGDVHVQAEWVQNVSPDGNGDSGNSGSTGGSTGDSTGSSTGDSTGGSTGSSGGVTGSGAGSATAIIVKVDDAAVDGAERIDQSAQGETEIPAPIHVELPMSEIMSRLHTADGKPLHVEVEISSKASVGPSAGTLGGLSAQVTVIRLQKEVIEAAKASGKDMTVTVRDERGNVYYRWTFRAEDLRNSGTPASDVNLSVHIIPVKQLAGDKQAVRDAVAAGSGISGGETPGFYIGFDHNGVLPAAAQVEIPVGNSGGFRPGGTAYLCWRDPVTGQIVNVPENQYTVDEHGFVTIRLDLARGYVLLPAPAAGAAQKPRPSGTSVHVVQKGDTLYKLARKYGCTVEDLREANRILDVYDLQIGQTIVVP